MFYKFFKLINANILLAITRLTDHYQIWSNEFIGEKLSYASLVAKEKMVTIATNAEVYKYVIFLSSWRQTW